MADEVNLEIRVPGDPLATMQAFRAQPPAWITDNRFTLADESYESLVYAADVMRPGMKLLMWGMARTIYRITATFRADGAGGTRLTLLGQAEESMRAAILAWAEANAAR